MFRIRAHNDGAVLPASSDALDELIGFVAAEANYESNRRRQQRLDTAFEALLVPVRWWRYDVRHLGGLVDSRQQ